MPSPISSSLSKKETLLIEPSLSVATALIEIFTCPAYTVAEVGLVILMLGGLLGLGRRVVCSRTSSLLASLSCSRDLTTAELTMVLPSGGTPPMPSVGCTTTATVASAPDTMETRAQYAVPCLSLHFPGWEWRRQNRRRVRVCP